MTVFLWIVAVSAVPDFIATSVAFIDSLGGTIFIRITATALMLAFGIAALGPDRLREMYDGAYTLLKGRESRGRLQRRSLKVAAEIQQFLSERDRQARPLKEHWPTSSYSGEERESSRQKHLQEIALFDDETMARYKRDFWGEALGLFEELQRRGWISSRYRGRFEHPVNNLDIEDVIALLTKFGQGHNHPMTWLDRHE